MAKMQGSVGRRGRGDTQLGCTGRALVLVFALAWRAELQCVAASSLDGGHDISLPVMSNAVY